MPNFLRAYPNVLQALVKYTGFSQAKIMASMQPGYGPKVVTQNNLTDSYGRKLTGRYDDVTKSLVINESYARGL